MSAVADKPVLDLKTVVYATDFSQCSMNAGPYAARVASRFSAELLVAHAFTLTQAASEIEAGERKASRQRTYLMGLLSEAANLSGMDAVKAVPILLEGDPASAIRQLADSNGPSMIVLGEHGRSRLEREIIGSVTETVLRSTGWPVLTVGSLVQPASSTAIPFRHILFATDFTPEAAVAAAYAAKLADGFGAEIDVLNVVEDGVLERPELLSAARGRFLGLLDGLLPEQALSFCDPSTFVATSRSRERIVEHIGDRRIDLLVLGLGKTSHVGMEMRTSQAFQIIVDAPCPVLTLRGQ